MAGKPESPRQYARMFEYFVAGSMLLSLAIGALAPNILAVFTRSAYVPAAPYALVLLIYFGPIGSIFGFLQIGFYVRKRTHVISVLYFISAAVNIVLNLLLNPIVGVWGAVWATVIAGTVLVTLAYFSGQHMFPVPYCLSRFFALTTAYLVLVMAFLLIPAFSAVTFKASALLLFALVIPAVGVVSRSQLQLGLQSVRYRLSRLAQPK
jgi:O-antigen/teichoic acid export membrane protein